MNTPQVQRHTEQLSLSVKILMLMSSRNTLTDKPRNHVLPALRVSLSLVKLTYKINQDKGFILLEHSYFGKLSFEF